jgi:O-antigen ligase
MAISSPQLSARIQRPGTSSFRRDVTVQAPSRNSRLTAAYLGTLLFALIYFVRPNDWLPIGTLPVAKIAALVPILGLLAAVAAGYRIRFTRELWLLLILFIQLAVCVPFSTWRGGSFQTVFLDFGKVALMTVILVQVLNEASRLRRLIFVHTAAVAAISIVSIHAGTQDGGRMVGVLGSIFGNPNDLAIAIALIVPFAVMFLLLSRNPLKRVLWSIVTALMVYAIIATYSRTGFLSLLVVILATGWYFGIKGKNKTVVIAILGLALLSPIAFTGKYLLRVESIFNSSLDATGSSDARYDLLIRSLKIAGTHPLFGIGPGQFVVQSGSWHVAHNSFTEMFAEAGFPGGILFVCLFGAAFNRLRKAAPDPSRHSRELLYLRAATLTSLSSFFVSAFFASLEYEFFSYFLVAYCSALVILMQPDKPSHARMAVSNLRHGVAACAE